MDEKFAKRKELRKELIQLEKEINAKIEKSIKEEKAKNAS